MDGIEDQQQDARETEGDAAGLLPGNGFLQEEEGEKHREDGAQGADDRRVDRRRHGDRHQEGHLRDEEPDQRSGGDLREIPPRDLFLREERGQQPEEEAGPESAQGEKDVR